jgi:guanylate kinase
MRSGEVDGKHYHFVASKKEFRDLTDRGIFLEHAEYNNNLYGTSLDAVEEPVAAGDDVLLEIEVQGAEQVKAKLPDACLIFLLPPSLSVLEERLRGRRTDSEEVIQHRMALVDRELAAAGHFDFAVINDDLDRAVDEVLQIIEGVRSGDLAAVNQRHGRAGVLDAWQAAQA